MPRAAVRRSVRRRRRYLRRTDRYFFAQKTTVLLKRVQEISFKAQMFLKGALSKNTNLNQYNSVTQYVDGRYRIPISSPNGFWKQRFCKTRQSQGTVPATAGAMFYTILLKSILKAGRLSFPFLFLYFLFFFLSFSLSFLCFPLSLSRLIVMMFRVVLVSA